MKKTLLIALLAFTIGAIAQEEENNYFKERKHEIRLDATELLIVPTLELNYEYVISKYSGVGAAISFNFSDEDDVWDGQNIAFTPYYRQYFLNRKEYGARGLFVEGNMQLALGDEFDYDGGSNASESDEEWFNIGAGLVLGQKWVSNNGFVFELSIGGGRYFIDDSAAPDAYFRGGLLVGYRF